MGENNSYNVDTQPSWACRGRRAIVCASETFHYWQAWVFLIVFVLFTWIPSIYSMRKNPAALLRRMRAGPVAETRRAQKAVTR
jgi:hypothetical protein